MGLIAASEDVTFRLGVDFMDVAVEVIPAKVKSLSVIANPSKT